MKVTKAKILPMMPLVIQFYFKGATTTKILLRGSDAFSVVDFIHIFFGKSHAFNIKSSAHILSLCFHSTMMYLEKSQSIFAKE